jgi:hypothetical protein
MDCAPQFDAFQIAQGGDAFDEACDAFPCVPVLGFSYPNYSQTLHDRFR